jgi:hypothetical protein
MRIPRIPITWEGIQTFFTFVMLAPLLAPILWLCHVFDLKCAKHRDEANAERWFAWYPAYDKHRECYYFLETVERWWPLYSETRVWYRRLK